MFYSFLAMSIFKPQYEWRANKVSPMPINSPTKKHKIIYENVFAAYMFVRWKKRERVRPGANPIK